jgi:hypothetical protein
MSSGDDIVAGQVTTCETTTDVVGALPNPPDVPFNGPVIFRVGPQQGELRPQATLDGIYGLGFNGPVPSPGGTGVTGFGGPNQGTGVLGRGGGAFNGSGGIGVDGHGGNVPLLDFITIDPGIGVIGRGGLQGPLETTGKPHGAGVVGIAGNGPGPSFMASGSVGVFGQGGNADRKSVTVNNVPGTAGPKDPGIGVLGIGGTQSDDGHVHGPGGPGVVGVAGGAALPSAGTLADTGVFGTGGVGGVFSAGGPAGVQPGDVPPGRAGVFLAHSAAQVRLVPHKAPKRPTATQPYTVQALVSKGEETEFPANGQTGDLLCTMMLVEGLATVEVGTLWFCERGA